MTAGRRPPVDASAANAPSVTATAPGKVNLYFAVGPVRPDGYHDVVSVYAAVDLTETATATLDSAAGGVSISTEIAAGSHLAGMRDRGEFDPSEIPADGRNLAVRAARLLLDHLGVDIGVRLDVVKEVPVAGGMAGGSADAAAALKAVNELVGVTGLADPLPAHALRELGARLGADVPFALLGGAAVGRGIGTELEPITVARDIAVEIVPAPFGLSTPSVFAELDRLRGSGAVPEPGVLEAPAGFVRALADPGFSGRDLGEYLRNDLQAAALSLRPELVGTLNEPCGGPSMVSGSGPTIVRFPETAGDGEPNGGDGDVISATVRARIRATR